MHTLYANTNIVIKAAYSFEKQLCSVVRECGYFFKNSFNTQNLNFHDTVEHRKFGLLKPGLSKIRTSLPLSI